jgi:inosine-uridine nucleoside N-ribohydrolase
MRAVVIDTDPGVDDALAILFLHRHPDVELVGITTVAGNGALDVVTRNALVLAERFAIDAPVARGAAFPLQRDSHLAPTMIHGVNGLGDVSVTPPTRACDPRPAHRFIIDSVRARPGEITLLGIGMLTNLARAITEDPGIIPLVREVVIMGGAFGTGGRYGNVQPAAEANIYCDPHAADLVFRAAWPLTIIGLDVTEEIVFTSGFLAGLRDRGGEAGRFIWEITRLYERFHRDRNGIAGIFAHDPSAAVCLLDDSAFVFRQGPVRVVLDGIAAGMTVQKPDARPFPPSPWDTTPSHRVAIAVDPERIRDTFAGPFSASRA